MTSTIAHFTVVQLNLHKIYSIGPTGYFTSRLLRNKEQKQSKKIFKGQIYKTYYCCKTFHGIRSFFVNQYQTHYEFKSVAWSGEHES